MVLFLNCNVEMKEDVHFTQEKSDLNLEVFTHNTHQK